MNKKSYFFAGIVFLMVVVSAHAAEIYVESRTGGKNFASYSEVGEWLNASGKSTASGCTGGIGSRYTSSSITGRTATFTFPAGSESGGYSVFITHSASTNTRSKCKVRITHTGGQIVVDYNQTTGANTWVNLGAYDMAAGTSRVELYYDAGALESGSLFADAVRFSGPIPTPTATSIPTPIPTMTPGIGDIIVESRAGGKNHSTANYYENGAFANSSAKSEAGGTTLGIGSRYFSMSFPAKQARFYLPTPQVPGRYEVFVTNGASGDTQTKGRWWVGTTTGRVGGAADSLNQTQNNNTWVSLGTYELRPGFGYVEVGAQGADTNTGYFFSDAAKFTGPLPTATPTFTPQPTPTLSSGMDERYMRYE